MHMYRVTIEAQAGIILRRGNTDGQVASVAALAQAGTSLEAMIPRNMFAEQVATQGREGEQGVSERIQEALGTRTG